jgi:PleD family two-component response regulator
VRERYAPRRRSGSTEIRWKYLPVAPIGEQHLSKKPMISIVDDDESVREGVKDLVGALGYNAFAFQSAEEFLNSEHIAETDCLITEIGTAGE